MSKENLEIIKRNWKSDVPKCLYPIIIKRKDRKKGEFYHNFATGEDSTFLEDVLPDGPVIMVEKESGKYNKFTDDIYHFYTKQTRQMGVAYDCVEHEGVKFLVIYVLQYDFRATLESDDEKREWACFARMYVDSEKVCYPQASFIYSYGYGYYYSNKEEQTNCDDFFEKNIKEIYERYAWHNFWNINNLSENYKDLNLKEACTKMGWGMVTVGNNTRRELVSGSNLLDFLKYKEPVKRSGPKQKKIEELVAKPLEEVVIPKLQKDKEDRWSNRFANISAIIGSTTPICCYRTFEVGIDGEVSEGARIYIEPKGKFTACKKNNVGEWVNVNIASKNDSFAYKITYANKDAIKGTVLEYLIPMLTDIDKENGLGALIATTLRHPCIEILYKAGFKDVLVACTKQCYSKMWDEVKNYFGELDEKGKTPYAIIGLNKAQIAVINELITPDIIELLSKVTYYRNLESPYQIIAMFKTAFGKQNITDIDIDTFKDMVNMFVDAYKFETHMINEGEVSSSGKVCKDFYWTAAQYVNHLSKAMGIIATYYPIATVRSMIPKMSELFKHMTETDKTEYDWSGFRRTASNVKVFIRTFDTYFAYLTMLREIYAIPDLEERPNFSCHFQNYDHIKVMHDDITPVCDYYRDLERNRMNEERYRIEKEKWERLKVTWKKWEYENDEYAVIYPVEPCSLTAEGTTLGHCVGGYIQRVLNRNTNIMFIRRKEALDKPFFTVEILTNGTIEQVHGRGNCNVNSADVKKTDPNLEAFVNEWAKKKGLMIHTINKIR